MSTPTITRDMTNDQIGALVSGEIDALLIPSGWNVDLGGDGQIERVSDDAGGVRFDRRAS